MYTIKHCLHKCGFKGITVNPHEEPDIDKEFEGTFAKLSARQDVFFKGIHFV